MIRLLTRTHADRAAGKASEFWEMSSEAPKIGSVARQAENLGCGLLSRRSRPDRQTSARGRGYVSGGAFQLALLGDALVRLSRALDTVLLFVAFGGEKPDHLIYAVTIAAAEQTGDDVNVVANAELVSQGSLRITQNTVWAATMAVAQAFVMGTMSL